MTPLLTVIIPGRPPDLHHGKHTTRWQRAAETKHRKQLVFALASGARHKARVDSNRTEARLLRVTVHWRGPRRDRINLLQDLKADVDGLVLAGWLADDNDEYLDWWWPPVYVDAPTERDVAIQFDVFPLDAKVS